MMQWEEERYVRLYTRDTISWLGLSWEARALFVFILRKVDRAGVIELGRSGVRGLAALVRMPDASVEASLPELVDDGCVELRGTTLVIPNFIEAQEARKSDNARQQESRLRRRDMLRAGMDPTAKATVIYFVQGEDGGPVKIGRADDLAKRLVGLGTGRPDKLVVLAAAPGTIQDEREIHSMFSHIREKGEWFSATDELMGYIRAVAQAGEGAFSSGVRLVTAEVTKCDGSRNVTVTRNVTPAVGVTVTPSLAVPSRTVPSCAEPRDIESSPSAPQPPQPKPKRSLKTQCPASTDPGVDEWLAAQGLPSLDSLDGAEVAKFLNRAASKGEGYSRWSAAWANWKANWDRYSQHEVGPAEGRGPKRERGALPEKDFGPIGPAPFIPRSPVTDVPAENQAQALLSLLTPKAS